jgi:hypothetical protein
LEGDEQTTLAMTNRGNLFSINWDDVINDNVGHIQKIPGKLARGAKRELYEAVFDLLWNAFSTNYEADGTAIIHADHNNTHGTPATLSATTIKRGRNAMMKQKELGTLKAMGIAPKYLIHQTKDWEDAYSLTTPAAGESNIIATAEQSLRLESIEVPHWVDTFDRWFLKSSEQDVESINVAFYQGKQEPEITQEAAGTGANFTAMKLRYRIHFPWACKVVDYRGIYGEKVS